MPEISRFFGIIVAMFYNDHNPPHFHARYGEHKAVIAIETGEIIEGRLPPRVLGSGLPLPHKSSISESLAGQMQGAPSQEGSLSFQEGATPQMAGQRLARREPRKWPNTALRPLERATAIPCGTRLVLGHLRGSDGRFVRQGQA